MDLKPKFLTDEHGERVGVLLSIEEFEEIADLLDDLADVAEIERRRTEKSIPHDQAMRLGNEDREIPD